MRLLDDLRSRLQYKIILPFLLLTLLVALTGSSIALLFITGNAQERLTNQLAQLARNLSDAIVQVERQNLAYLREIAFAQANPATGAPAIAEALGRSDRAGLAGALDPYAQISGERGVTIDRLIVFDRSGQSLLDWELSAAAAGGRIERPAQDLQSLWFVPSILQGRQDATGDKYAGLLNLGAQTMLYTAVPVTDAEGRIVGGVIAAAVLDGLLNDLARQTQAAVITIYEPTTGEAFASTILPVADLSDLRIRPAILADARSLQTDRRSQGLLDRVVINEREYQLAYAPLSVRGTVVALVSVGLAADYVINPWADVRFPLILLTAALTTAIFLLGIVIARQITRPLTELVDTAEAVMSGDLKRRSSVTSHDEVGTLAGSFNAMTEHLLDMYGVVRAEASQRAAIFESIADAIVVTTPDGTILMANSAFATLLDLAPEQPLPRHIDSVALRPLDENAWRFGSAGAKNLFQLHDRAVRVSRSAIRGDNDALNGYVVVFQDLTDEVAVDRAKTNFIATISHELRTPLTVITGNIELILSGLMGDLPDDQRKLLETARRYIGVTTALTNNMITIAKLDSGTMPFELVPLSIADLVRERTRSFQRTLSAKGLELRVAIPADLPNVIADPQMLQLAIEQLFDNAQRYTRSGHVQIRLARYDTMVRCDISDTGPGIEPELREQLFSRFSRGSEGINSVERGIGLGLAIAREVIERQNGRIWLEQTSPQGSTFSFTLPQSAATQHAAPSDKLHIAAP